MKQLFSDFGFHGTRDEAIRIFHRMYDAAKEAHAPLTPFEIYSLREFLGLPLEATQKTAVAGQIDDLYAGRRAVITRLRNLEPQPAA